MAKAKLEGRIRFDSDWNGHGEHFVFEIKQSSEKEWGLASAFRLLDFDDGDYHEEKTLVNYQAITTIREWMRLGVQFHFGK